MNQRDRHRQRVATEVIELGEALFDSLIEATSAPRIDKDAEDEHFPEEDVRAAADEFFAALRVLLGLQND